MKTIPAPVLAILAGRQFYLCDLYTITLVDGTIHRYCTGDVDIVYSGDTYSCGGQTGPYFKREGAGSTITWQTGLQVSTLNIDVYPGPSGTINGVAWSTAVSIGMFDFADFRLDRAVMTTYADVSAGIIPAVFVGTIGDIVGGRGSGESFTINSYNDLLDIQMPRNLYQSPCVNTLFDPACTLIKASFAVSVTVASGSTVSSINATLSQATGYFDLGSIAFTSGANNGVVRSVKSSTLGTPSNLIIFPPLYNTPAPGDTATAYPGCDKAIGTCQNKFSNLNNFRGFPGIPSPETSI